MKVSFSVSIFLPSHTPSDCLCLSVCLFSLDLPLPLSMCAIESALGLPTRVQIDAQMPLHLTFNCFQRPSHPVTPVVRAHVCTKLSARMRATLIIYNISQHIRVGCGMPTRCLSTECLPRALRWRVRRYTLTSVFARGTRTRSLSRAHKRTHAHTVLEVGDPRGG